MPWGVARSLGRGLGLFVVAAGLLGGVQAQTVLSFHCPARVQTQSAQFESPSELAGFASRFPATSTARLVRLSVQQGQGAEASDIKPQVSRDRRTWNIAAAGSSNVTFWCHYEAGIALARILRQGLGECEAEPAAPSHAPAGVSGRFNSELGRVSVTCR